MTTCTDEYTMLWRWLHGVSQFILRKCCSFYFWCSPLPSESCLQDKHFIFWKFCSFPSNWCWSWWINFLFMHLQLYCFLCWPGLGKVLSRGSSQPALLRAAMSAASCFRALCSCDGLWVITDKPCVVRNTELAALTFYLYFYSQQHVSMQKPVGSAGGTCPLLLNGWYLLHREAPVFRQSFPIRRLQELICQTPDHGTELLGLQAMVRFKCERVLAVNGLIKLWVGLKGQWNDFSTLRKGHKSQRLLERCAHAQRRSLKI